MKKFLSLFAAVLLAGSVVADTFGLLTDASDLAAGDQIIIVNAEGTFAMSTTQNNNNRGLAAVEVEDNLIEPSANVQIITLEADGSNWKFNVGDDAYLYAASSSANHLKTNTAATVGDNGTWKITIDGEGLAEIVAQGGNSRNRMLYNSGNSIISCYGANSTQAQCKIYKKGGTPQATVEYYLVGTMNSWEPATGYKFSKNTAAEGEEYKLDVTLEANAQFKGRKVVDGVEDAWYPDNCGECNKVVETAGDYTIYLRPNGDGGDDWHYNVLYAEYHEPVVLPTITCAEVNTADNGTAAKLNPVSVVYVGENDARYCYIADESGMTLLYKNDHGLAAGKLVSGIEGSVTVYSQLHEFVPSNTINDWTVTDEGVIPTFAEQTTAPAANQENQIIVLKGVFVDNTVTFSTTSVGSNVTAHIGEANFQMRNTFKVGMTLEQGKLYDVTGAVSRYNSTIQFIPISAEEETVDPGTVEYYLAGWINSDEYAYGGEAESQSEYKFLNNRIVVNFAEEAAILVRTYEDTPKFYGAEDNVVSEEENYQVVLADGNEGMVTIPANREATIEISIDESGVMTMSVALAHSYTCAEVNAAAQDEVINLNPATVAYLGAGDNRYCYLSDESGMTLLYKNGHGLQEGQLVSGLKGKLSIYNGLPELVPTNTIANWTIGVGTMPEYAELTEAPGVEMVNQIVVLKNVSVAEDVTFTTDAVNNANATIAGATIKLRNTFKVPMTLEASKMYDLTVAVARYVKNETAEIQFFPIAAQEVDVPVVEKHYYLIGIDNWNVEDLTEERELVLNEESDAVEYMIDWTLEQGNEFQIVEWDGEGDPTWYPGGENNNYVVDAAHAGPSTIYFRPLKDGGDDWHYNYIYVETHPVEHHYYLMGIDVWNIADLTEDRLLVKNEGTDANEYMINWTLAEGNEFQIVDWDGEDGEIWFPGGNANYVVDAAHAGAATIYFRPYRDGDEAWHEGCIYVQVAEVEKHYYLMGIDVWNVADLTEDRLLVKNEGTDANEYMINWTLAEGNEFQIVEWDGEDGETWFPGGDANYVVDADHAGEATIYFRPLRDGDDAWFESCIYVSVEVGPAPEPEHYQIVGGFTSNWDINAAIEFEDVEGVLTAEVPNLSGAFKIVKDRNWATQWGRNSEVGGLEFAQPYVLTPKVGNPDPDNISLANPFGTYTNASLTLRKNEAGELILTLEEGEFELNVQDWYVPGEYLGWNCNEATKMTRLEGDEDIYEIQLPEFGDRFKVVYGNWMVEYGAVSDEAVDGWFFDGEMELVSPCHDIHCTYGENERYANVTIQIEVDYENAGVILRMTREEPCEPAYQIKAGEQTIDLVANPAAANEVMALDIELQAGTQFKLFEVCSEAEFTAVTNDGYQFEIVEGAYVVAEDGIYSFYLAPAYQNDRLYVSKYMGPTSKAADPEWPALQVKAVYSDTYNADCNFGWWDSYTTYEQTEYGKHFTTVDRGYFGLEFDALNCSKMESFHMDVWPTEDMTLRIVPIHGGAEQGVTVNLTAGQWNGVEADLNAGDWANVEDWSNVYQIKIDNAPNRSFWLDNVYFYTSQVPEDDHDAPTGLQAQVVAESYFSAVIEAVAEDNSGEVVYSVVNGGLMIASASGNSGVPVRITVNELQGGYEYHFNVVARDPQGNDAEPVEVTVHTLATPDPAPQPEYAAEDVMSIYSAYYNPAVEFGYQDWWMGATQSEGDLAQNNLAMCYVPRTTETSCFGWSFAAMDITAYDRFEMDVYAVEDGALDFALIDATPRAVYPLQGGQWNHIVIDIAGNEKTDLTQLGFYENQNSGTFFVQNVLFVKEPVVYNYFMVGAFCGWDLANAVMFEDVEGVLAAMIPSMTGGFKIVKCAGETAQWGDEFGAHTQGDVIALNPQGEYILKHNDAKDLNVEGRYNNAVFTLTESEGEMVLHFVAGTVDETTYFVLAGDWNSWNNNDDNATFQEVEGALRLEVADISGEVKVFVKGGWVPQAGGPAGADPKDVLVLGEPYAMAVRLLESQPDLSNLLIAPVGYGYHNAVIELTADLETATVSITIVSGELYDTSSNPKTYQVVGAFNSWDAASAIEFEEVEGVLTATVADLNGTFKIIQDHAWTNQWATNWETGARLAFNEPYVLGAKTETAEPANLALVNLFGGYHNAVLTLDPETMTLTLVEGESYRVEADWYVPGAWQDPEWKCNDYSKMSPVEGQENTYEILLPDFGKAFKVVYGEWMVEFGAAKGSGDTWMLDQDIELATPCDNLNSAYGDQMLQDVTITIVVDYENGAVSLNITSEGEVQPTLYYIKNNWNGEADWTWKQMTPSNNGDEWMFEGVFGGTGVNINTAMSDEGQLWFPVGEAYEGHVIEGDDIQAGQTVRFVYSVSANTVTATVVETGIENVVLDAVKAQKMLIDGHIYIIRDGRMFNVQGARVR